MTAAESNGSVAVGMRWSARIAGLLAGGLFAQFILESGLRMIPTLSWGRPDGMPFFIALVVAVAGGLIGWRWEAIGGGMAMGGAVIIIALTYIGSGSERLILALVLTFPLLVAGSVYLACWRMRISAFHKERAQQVIQTHGNSAIAALQI